MEQKGLSRAAVAVIIGVVTFLVVAGVGVVLEGVDVTSLSALGSFMKGFSWLVGLLAGAFYYFTGKRLV